MGGAKKKKESTYYIHAPLAAWIDSTRLTQSDKAHSTQVDAYKITGTGYGGEEDRQRSSRRTATHLLNGRAVFSAGAISRQILIGMDSVVPVVMGDTLVHQRGMSGWVVGI